MNFNKKPRSIDKTKVENSLSEMLDEYSKPATPILERIHQSKEDIINSTINELQKLIDERKHLNKKTIDNINREISRTREVTMELFQDNYYQIDKSDRMTIEMWINNLEKSKIHENVQSWQDVVILKRDIVNLTTKLLESRERRELL